MIYHKKHSHISAPYSVSGVRRTGFDNVIKQNQPDKPLYHIRPVPKIWWQKGLLEAALGITAYIDLGKRTGFGIGDPGISYHNVPKFMDRASPVMWI